MKDYLQLEGLVYKLVPIKTEKNKNNPYLMGRLDEDLMFDIVKNWEWGNSDSPKIYHDPETRKNSISYRSNMARLAEVLVDKGKNDKAKYIADLAMEKMPIDYFGFYSLISPFIEIYYRLNENDNARDLFDKVSYKYFDRLNYFNSLELELQYSLGEEILTEIERYRALVETIIDNRDKSKSSQSISKFQEISSKFIFLYGKYEYYTIMVDFVEGHYISGNTDEARKLVENIAQEFDKRFKIISELSEENQKYLDNQIKEEMNKYRKMLIIVNSYDSEDYVKKLEERVFDVFSMIENVEKMYLEN